MKVRFALQGRVVERTVLAGAFLVVLLEPPRFHWPKGRHQQLIQRTLRFVRLLPSGAWLCLSVSERWI